MSIRRRLVAVTAACLVALGLTAVPAAADDPVVTESDGVFQADGTYQASYTPGNARNTVTLWASCSPDGDATVAVTHQELLGSLWIRDAYPTLEVWGQSDSGFIPAFSSGESTVMRIFSGKKNTPATTASVFVLAGGGASRPALTGAPFLYSPSGRAAIPADGE
ncbi:hypothetical protein [Isoptericola haloaureus]|uniref:Secreted protein n=1 Tax=Isoptericola haloaureus TaxID=1542902 RepID=A0ABU7ZAA5_9MICO